MLDWQRNRLRWEPTADSLPCARTERKGLLSGAVGVTGGLALSGVLLTGAVGGILREGFRWQPLLAAAPFGLVALALFAFGLARLFQRRDVRLTYHFVECRERGLFGEDRWREPLFSYRGVESSVQHHAPGSDARAASVHEIWLRHPDPQKDILLFRAHSGRHLDSAWRHFAKLLNLPALEAAVRVETRPSDGPLEALPEAHEGLSARVKLKRFAGGYCAIHPRVWGSWTSALGVILTGALYLVTPSFVPQESAELPLTALLVFFLAFLSLFVAHVVSAEELWVTRQELRYQIRYPWGRVVKTRLSTRGVRRIDVAGDPHRNHLPAALCIEGREGLILFGRYASADDKTRLATLVRTVLGTTDSPRQSA